MSDNKKTDNGLNANCSNCYQFTNCKQWKTLLSARNCPTYDDGTKNYLKINWQLLKSTFNDSSTP